jgi:hypothetical protein
VAELAIYIPGLIVIFAIMFTNDQLKELNDRRLALRGFL